MTDYRHPLMQKRDQKAFLQKIQSLMERDGLDALMIVVPQNIYYTTGYISAMAWNAGIPAGVVALAMIPRQGDAVLFMTGLESEDAKLQTRHVEVVPLPTFYFIDDGTDASRQERNVDFASAPAVQMALDAIRDSSPDPVIGVEMGMIPFGLANVLLQQIDQSRLKDCGALLTEARKIKFPWEVDIMRMAAQHWDRVVRTVAPQIQPGMNLMGLDDLLMKTAWEQDTEHTLKDVLIVTGCGPLIGVGGLPRNYVLQEGDVIKIDVGGIHLGYCTDISRVWSVGKPDPAKAAVFDLLLKGFHRGMEMLKPGVRISDMYNECRAIVEASDIIPKYPRGHLGHSLSLAATVEDHPWITADEHSVFEPGMVMCHEMSYAATGNTPHEGSYNIEDTVVITEDGHERFTYANESFDWSGE